MKKTQMIILAGGSGERFGGELPKQFVKIAGKTIMEHTIEKIEQCSAIDSMILVVNEKYYDYMNELIVRNHFKRVKKVIMGGKSRQESSYIGIEACDRDTVNVLFHDAIRPFVSERILLDTITALDTYEAVDVAIPCADTIIKVGEGNVIESIPKRKDLMRGQTPQGFRLSLIKKAYERYWAEQDIEVTDDCGIIEQYKMADIYVVNGEEQNMKVTYKEDAYLADKLFQIHSMELLNQRSEEEIGKLLEGKIGVVFGHTSGIGKDILKMVEEQKGKVYGFSRSTGVDVANSEQVENALQEVFEKEGRIDYVINTAGKLSISKLEAMQTEEIASLIQTNYFGIVNTTKAAIPYLRKTQGMMVLFTSSSYTRGRALYSIYSSTKAAVVNFAQAMSEELYEDKIKINVINPERTDTPMRRSNFGIEPKGTLLSSKEVALETLKTVCSNLTGQVIDVRIKKDRV